MTMMLRLLLTSALCGGALLALPSANATADEQCARSGLYNDRRTACVRLGKEGRQAQRSASKPQVANGTTVNHFSLCMTAPSAETNFECTNPTLCDDGRGRWVRVTSENGAITDTQTYCATPRTQQIAAAAQEEFYVHKVHVPPPSVQPDTTVLVQWPVVFYSTTTQTDTPTTLLGEPVTLRLIPVTYLWTFGDGNSSTTSSPGNAINLANYNDATDPRPEIENDATVTHRYGKCGFPHATLTVTFRGQYAVAGGEFQTLQGTITAQSPATAMHTREARAELITSNKPPPPPPTPQPCTPKNK